MLCEIYEQPPDVLFAHQDQGLTASAASRLLAGFPDLQRAMLATVTGALRLDSLPIVQAAYHQALLTLLHAP